MLRTKACALGAIMQGILGQIVPVAETVVLALIFIALWRKVAPSLAVAFLSGLLAAFFGYLASVSAAMGLSGADGAALCIIAALICGAVFLVAILRYFVSAVLSRTRARKVAKP